MTEQLSLLDGRLCNRCKTIKPLDDFYRNRKMPLGRNYTCIACERKRIRDYADYDRRRTPEQIAAKRAADRTPEARARSAAARRALPFDHPSRVKVRARVKRWRAENPEKRANEVRVERARRSVGRDAEAVKYALTLRADPCSYCGGRGDEVDHIVPVAAGGANTWDNLTAACRRCNPSKSDTPLLTFLLQRRGEEA